MVLEKEQCMMVVNNLYQDSIFFALSFNGLDKCTFVVLI